MRQLADDFDENGVLRDGKRFRVPMKFADSKSRYADQQKRNSSTIYDAYDIAVSARIHDGNGNSGAALQRPGFRVADAFARDEAKVAYQQYEAAIQNEWRSIRPADFGGPSVGRNENACDQDKIEDYLSDLDADVDQHVKAFDRQRDGTSECGPREQSSDAASLTLANLYAERDRELQDQWRRRK
jgi:hypothetical protein